ncbi:MAG: DUF523 domain-containing protein [Anaerolineales bacterium]|nr:MAG: DUF523 domain-containing protein [Anaerolineales bacterium]
MDGYLVSACLLGIYTRYDGGCCPVPQLIQLAARGLAVPVCPEVAGGLPIPRPPAEIVGGDGLAVLDGRARVLTIEGEDVTEAFLAGARQALETAQRLGIRQAVLKEDSPSCGSRRIYDGTFSGRTVSGQGVAAALLQRNGITVLSEEERRENRWTAAT